MQIGSALSAGAFSPLTATSTPSSSSTSSASTDAMMASAPTGDSSTDLMRFLKMTPAQKMDYQWMSSHHITQQSLSSMSQTQRDALRDQMSSELQQRAQQTLEAKTAQANGGVNIVV